MFDEISNELTSLVLEWEPKLVNLPERVLTEKRNSQNRSIKQIIGHMVDSASNNTHRTVQLQYRETPLRFHNYATFGNNDRWIAIQKYEDENWENLVQLWKYTNLHFAHIIQNIHPENVNNTWFAGAGEKITLQKMVEDFLRHFKLHISEIESLLVK